MRRLTFLLMILSSFVYAESAREALIKKQLKPIGEVHIGSQTSAAPSTTAASGEGSGASVGEKRYQAFCHTCHAMGLAGAPKFGDKAAWAPRVKQGKDVLYEHAIKGFKAMPPKGTCMQCTEDEIKAAVNYMLEHSK